MAKKVKMCLFGRPGTGKSTFASKAPNPFYLATDGNFEWLNLPDSSHVRLSTWKEAKAVINDIVLNKSPYDKKLRPAYAGRSFRLFAYYPSATSRIIISAKPRAAPMVPMLECAPAWDSGMSSSTTT